MARYQGATVRHWDTGRNFYLSPSGCDFIHHIDVSSQYPSAMIVFNLSPESVRLEAIKPYTGEYRFDAATGYIEVPDVNYGQVCCRVDTSKDSVTRSDLIRLFIQKAHLKVELKRCLPDEKAELEARYNFVKVQLNSRYGYNGLSQSMYGNMLVALLTTAFGRFIIDVIIRVCEGLGVQPLETDTDGLWVWNTICTGETVVEAVNSELHRLFKDWVYSDCTVEGVRIGLNVDLDTHAGMLIYKMKNYVVYDRHPDYVDKETGGYDSIHFKGASFHGRSMPQLCNVAINRFAIALFRGESLDGVWGEFSDLKRLPLRYFTMNASFNKSEYEGDTLYAKLIAQFTEDDRRYLGGEVYYVKVRGDPSYVPLGVLDDAELKRRIDYKYYRERLRCVVNERLLAPYRGSVAAPLLSFSETHK